MRDRAYELWRLRRCGLRNQRDPWASNESSELATAAAWKASKDHWLGRVLLAVGRPGRVMSTFDLAGIVTELKGADE